jgi:hypothetical protein
VSETCGNCKFFSEMIAESEGCGPIKAMCLCGFSKHHGQMVSEKNMRCDFYAKGTPIDMPEVAP